jgi:type IV secretory pathway TraG/TraD family ATPase VirD4
LPALSSQYREEAGDGEDVWYNGARIAVAAIIRRLWETGRGSIASLSRALRDMTPDELREMLAGTEAARLFEKDAEKATASVLFCLAEASKVVGTLKPDAGNDATGYAASISFDEFYGGLAEIDGPKPWIFLASRKRNFAAARPLLGCWLDCAIASILDRPASGAPRAWLILDELPVLPRASGLLTLLPEGRKFGAAIVMAFQAIGQLRETYAANSAGTIVGQAGTQLVMRLGDPESTTWATQLLGKSEIEEHRASQSLDSDAMTDRGSLSTMRQTKPIVLDSQIGQLPPLEGFLRMSGLPVARVRIDRAHMDRPDIAETTVAPVAATWAGQGDRTLGGAL